MREGFPGGEQFAPSSQRREGGPLEEELTGEGSRRDALSSFLREASDDPRTLQDGLDVEKLNAVLREANAGDVEHVAERGGLDQFTTTFHPDIKYATLAAVERAKDEELTPELREARGFMEFFRGYLAEVGKRHKVELRTPESSNVIIGIGRKQTDGEAPIVGGFHAGLNEQGYKFFDATLQENMRMDTDEAPEYRVADMLRSLAHDSVHSAQYKLFGSASQRREHWERKRDAASQAMFDDPSATEEWVAANEGVDRMKRIEKISDADLRQYGSVMPGLDHGIKIDGKQTPLSLGAALFEYTTDRVAREAVREYQRTRGTMLPEPKNELERLARRDLGGERIDTDEVRWGELREKSNAFSAVNEMVSYGESILKPAEHVRSLLGPLCEDFDEAMEEAVFTGKFRKMKALRERMGELEPKAREQLQKYAKKGAMVLRPLFTEAPGSKE